MQGLLPHSTGLLPVQERNLASLAVGSRTYRCSPLNMQPWPALSQVSSARCRHIAQAKPSEQEQLQAETSSRLQQAGSSTDSSTESSQGGVNRLLVLGGLVAVAASILYAAGGLSGLKDKVHDLEDLIGASGYLGPVVYAGAYTASTVLLFPASVLTLAAGYLFGPLKGTAVVSVSATAGACLAFLVSRYLARPVVEAKVAENPKFQAVYSNITADGAKLVLLLRLSPLIPFNLLNYGLGITQVRFLDYAWASWLGMLPGTFAYVYLGSLGKVAADVAGDGAAADGGIGSAKLLLYAVGAVATIWATKLISTAAGKAVDGDQAQQSSQDAASSKDSGS